MYCLLLKNYYDSIYLIKRKNLNIIFSFKFFMLHLIYLALKCQIIVIGHKGVSSNPIRTK